MNSDDRQENKKKYEEPRVTVISLRPEEAVLGNCKSASSAGPVSSQCTSVSCNTIGS